MCNVHSYTRITSGLHLVGHESCIYSYMSQVEDICHDLGHVNYSSHHPDPSIILPQLLTTSIILKQGWVIAIVREKRTETNDATDV